MLQTLRRERNLESGNDGWETSTVALSVRGTKQTERRINVSHSHDLETRLSSTIKI